MAIPVIVRALKLSLQVQANLAESELDDPVVFESFVADPDTSLTELGHDLEDVPKIEALLVPAKRAARVQRAEFANRGPDVLARADRERKRKGRVRNTSATDCVTEGGRWRYLRSGTAEGLPSRLGRSSDSRETAGGREKAEEEDRLRYSLLTRPQPCELTSLKTQSFQQ